MNLSTGPPLYLLQQLALSTGKSVCSILCVLPLLFILGVGKQVSDYSNLFLSEVVAIHEKEMEVVGVPSDCKSSGIHTPLRL